MKLTTITLSTLLLSPVAMSAESPTKLEYCTGMPQLAEAAMMARQSSVPLHALLANPEVNTNDIAVMLVKMAYNEPVMRADKNKVAQINEFSSKVMLTCLDSVEI